MAPSTTKTATRNGAAGRRAVVPAIPLPYVRRSKPQTKEAPPTTNGSSLKIQHNAEPATPETVTLENSKTKEGSEEQEENVLAVTKNESVPDASNSEPTPSSTETDSEETIEETKAPEVAENQPAEPELAHHVAAPEPSHRVSNTDGALAQAPVAQPPPAVPPSRYALPPSFHPSGRPINPLINGDAVRGPRPGMNGPAHLHHPRPSNGSLQFGGFGSDSSSPAPPHSAGFGPPPGLPAPHDGRRPFQGHGHTPSGHGYPHMMPYGTEFVPVTAADNYGRHQATTSGVEPHPFPGSNYGQTTPLSYQGSNSPNHPDDSGTFGHFHPLHGPNGPHDEHRHRHQASRGFNGPPSHRMMPGPMPPQHMPHPMQEPQGSEAWTSYLQSQFQDTAFADCTIELRYVDDRAPPVQIPGHRIVLARSQPIRSILQSSSFESSPSGQPSRVVLLLSDDKYLRSEAFWMAVQRLYGYPLLQTPEPQAMRDGHFALAGNPDSRFDFALAYAAAGHLLEWPEVVFRGIEIAAHHLSWTTLEKAVEFVLTDVNNRTAADNHTPFHYGEAVEILIEAIISFIVHHLSPLFRLDTSVADPADYARIPPVPTAASASAAEPPVANGHTVQLNHVSRSRPTHIKFGDMGESQENGLDGAQLSPQDRHIRETLSRVLLNLPFAIFKPIFEYAESRFQNGRPLLAEREARRLRALEAVVHDKITGAAEIRQILQSVEPQQSGVWHVLGWQEEMVPYNKEGPSLGRQWQPLAQASEQARGEPEATRPSYP